MKFSEIEQNLIFGQNLTDLAIYLTAYELKRISDYPKDLVQKTISRFSNQYTIPLDSFPKRLKSLDIPYIFVDALNALDSIKAHLISLGYHIGAWFQLKYLGSDELQALERKNRRAIEDFNYDVPNIREDIKKILKKFENLEGIKKNTQILFDELTYAISDRLKSNTKLHQSASANLIFISYSKEDKEWLERLQVFLKPLEREGIIQRWDDTLIEPGENWMKEIKSALASTKVGIFLVSANFLANDFISDEEIPFLLNAAKNRGVVILPIIINPCRFKKTKGLSDFQAVNNPSNPLVKLNKGEQDDIFNKVANTIEKLLSK